MLCMGHAGGVTQSNPTLNTNKREEHPRDRVLTADEIRHIWAAADDTGTYGTVIKLLILTGQRREEIGGLQWSEVDFARGVISLGRERTKNNRAHEIPISATVLSLLSERPRDHEFVIGRRAFCAWSRMKRLLDASLAIAPWVVHDLRRTVATGMIDIGVAPHIVEAVLNHFSGHRSGVAGIYNRSSYAAEKAEALAKWDRRVMEIVHGP